jgi:putative addiction module component (TIGR02574 family)
LTRLAIGKDVRDAINAGAIPGPCLLTSIHQITEKAQLPSSDRATLAGLLIESLEPAPEQDVEAAWSEEIARRVAELDAGTVETIPWEEVRAELFGRRNERQIPSGGS